MFQCTSDAEQSVKRDLFRICNRPSLRTGTAIAAASDFGGELAMISKSIHQLKPSDLHALIGNARESKGSVSKWLLVIISSHVALAISFHRGLKVSEGMKAFRHGESEFYDLYRRLMDRPYSFGKTEEEQIDAYFSEVERVRKFVRHAETETIPDLESLKNSEHPKRGKTSSK
jgi:hypothetical protein